MSHVIDGRYRIIEHMGSRPVPVLYRAEQISLERTVVLRLAAPGVTDGDETQFTADIRALARLRNKHVVEIVGFGKTPENALYFVMEYVEGESLAARLRTTRASGKFVGVARAAEIALQVATGLSAAHAAGLVHRRIHPSNILIETSTSRCVVSNFVLPGGFAEVSEERITRERLYISPEQLDGGEGPHVSAQADTFGLACVVHELLCGVPPERLNGKEAPYISSIDPDLFPFDEALRRGLSRAAMDRPESILEFASAVGAAARVFLRRRHSSQA